MAKEIIFLLTHRIDDVILNNIRKINREKGARDFAVLVHGEKDTSDLEVPVYHFSLDQLKVQKFKMLEEDSMFSSVHLAFLYFFKKIPDYDHYWFIEYDVEFGGKWYHLFDTFVNSHADFISSYIQPYNENEYWPWWGLDHPEKKIPVSRRIRSFNPIYRVSKEALKFLCEELKTGWVGHHEVMLSTLLHKNDFKLLDLRGDREFGNSEYPNFYRENAHFPTSDDRFLKLGSLRYRPAMKKAGSKNIIYHPVKMDMGLSRFEETVYQLSLLKKKMKRFF